MKSFPEDVVLNLRSNFLFYTNRQKVSDMIQNIDISPNKFVNIYAVLQHIVYLPVMLNLLLARDSRSLDPPWI
jgi:hypothetical protein